MKADLLKDYVMVFLDQNKDPNMEELTQIFDMFREHSQDIVGGPNTSVQSSPIKGR